MCKTKNLQLMLALNVKSVTNNRLKQCIKISIYDV